MWFKHTKGRAVAAYSMFSLIIREEVFLEIMKKSTHTPFSLVATYVGKPSQAGTNLLCVERIHTGEKP